MPDQKYMSFLSPTFYCFVLVDVSAFDPSVHLAWGDVSISGDNQVLRVFLKRSKTDQYGCGTEVFIGVTCDELCPIQAVFCRTSPFAVSPQGRLSVHWMAVRSRRPASLSWYGRHWLGQEYPSPGIPGIASGSAPQPLPPKQESRTRQYRPSAAGRAQLSCATSEFPGST